MISNATRWLLCPPSAGALDENAVGFWLASLSPEQFADATEARVKGRQLDDAGLGPLAPAILQRCLRLLRLDLSGNAITDRGASLLAECIASLRAGPDGSQLLTTLNLAGNQISGAAVEAIALSFFPTGGMESGGEFSLALSGNPIGDHGTSILATTVSKRQCLAALHLCEVDCGAQGCKCLAENLQWLSALDLSYNSGIPPASLTALVAALSPPLRRLSLSHLSSARRLWSMELSQQAFGEALRRCETLTLLSLSGNNLQDSGLKMLAGACAARAMPLLEELDLAGNRLRDGNVLASLLAGIGVQRLRIVNLESNELGDLALVALAAGMALSPRLHRLTLARNRFGDGGAVAIANTVRHQRCASKASTAPGSASGQWPGREEHAAWLLSIADLLGRVGAQEVAADPDEQHGVRELDLSFNMITDQGAQSLAEAVSQDANAIGSSGQPCLRFLDLYQSSIGAAGSSALDKAIRASHMRVEHHSGAWFAALGLSGSPVLVPPPPEPWCTPWPLRVQGLGLEALDLDLSRKAVAWATVLAPQPVAAHTPAASDASTSAVAHEPASPLAVAATGQAELPAGVVDSAAVTEHALEQPPSSLAPPCSSAAPTPCPLQASASTPISSPPAAAPALEAIDVATARGSVTGAPTPVAATPAGMQASKTEGAPISGTATPPAGMKASKTEAILERARRALLQRSNGDEPSLNQEVSPQRSSRDEPSLNQEVSPEPSVGRQASLPEPSVGRQPSPRVQLQMACPPEAAAVDRGALHIPLPPPHIPLPPPPPHTRGAPLVRSQTSPPGSPEARHTAAHHSLKRSGSDNDVPAFRLGAAGGSSAMDRAEAVLSRARQTLGKRATVAWTSDSAEWDTAAEAAADAGTGRERARTCQGKAASDPEIGRERARTCGGKDAKAAELDAVTAQWACAASLQDGTDEPEGEAPAVPERTENLERQVAELREDVRRIESTVISLNPEPESEVSTDVARLPEASVVRMPPASASFPPQPPMLPPGATMSKAASMPASGAAPAPGTPSASPKSAAKEGASPSSRTPGASSPKAALQLPPKGRGKGVAPPLKRPGMAPKGPPAFPKGALKAFAKAASGGKASFEKPAAETPFQRKLYWKPLDVAETEGTVFHAGEQQANKTAAPRLDIEALNRMFEGDKSQEQEKRRKSAKLLSNVQMKVIGTKLLSDHRARNIAIVLRRLSVSTKELARILRQLEWEATQISTDDLEQILECIPTQEESEKLREHRAPEAREKLRDVEQMVMPLALMSRGSARVRLLVIARNARISFSSASRSFAAIRSACESIHRSAMLREVMQFALDLGNYINCGDSSKGAKAISIGSLMTLKDFKAARGMSSLHFLCASLHFAQPERDAAEVLARELRPVIKSSNISVQTLQASARTFDRDLEIINSECRNFIQEYTSLQEGQAGEVVEPDEEQVANSAVAAMLADASVDASVPFEDAGDVTDAARWVEDVIKIRGSASARLRCMRRVVEKLCKLQAEKIEQTAVQAQATLRFCGVPTAAAVAKQVPNDLEPLLAQLADFMKVFKTHLDEVRADLPRYQQLFSES